MKIVKKYISNNRSGESFNPVGMVLHATATPGADADTEYRCFNNNNMGASAHAFIDWNGMVVETVPYREVAWHCMYTGNHRFIGAELCEPSGYDKAKFDITYKTAVEYFAYVFKNILKITKITSDNLMSHAEVSRKWRETDHLDPEEYFRKYGKTVQGFRNDVQAMINNGTIPSGNTTIGKDQGIITADVLNVRNNPDGAIIGQVYEGEIYRIHKKVGNWYSIYWGESGGYVSADYVKTEFGKEQKPVEPSKPVPPSSTPNIPVTSSSRRNVIIYNNDVDGALAFQLSWYLDDCILKKESEYKPGDGRSVYIIGAACNSKIEAHVRIQGKNRFETKDLVDERIKYQIKKENLKLY